MATSTSAASAPRSNKSLLIAIVFLGAAILAALGVVGYLVVTRPAQAGAPAAPIGHMPIFVPFEPWTVNLQSDGRNRFLHVGFTLKVADEASRERISQYQPEVRSRILTLLSNRDAATLATAEDKARLAGEVAAAVNRPFAAGLPGQQVTDVMFTAFVLQ